MPPGHARCRPLTCPVGADARLSQAPPSRLPSDAERRRRGDHAAVLAIVRNERIHLIKAELSGTFHRCGLCASPARSACPGSESLDRGSASQLFGIGVQQVHNFRRSRTPDVGVFACRDGEGLREAEAGFLVSDDVDAGGGCPDVRAPIWQEADVARVAEDFEERSLRVRRSPAG